MKPASNIVSYIKKMREIQSILLTIINSEGSSQLDFDELILNFNKLKILGDHDIFRSFLHLLSHIYENHHQFKETLITIENIILYYKKDILNNFHNSDIFSIFRNDKRIILFLLKSEILQLDNFLIRHLKGGKYSIFFYPEIKNHLTEKEKSNIESQIPDDFLQKRLICENDSNLCEIIRNDEIEQFIAYISRTNCSLSSTINESIFETNIFLNGKNPSLIEYAAFFGSIQIFQYIYRNHNVELNESLWFYAVHSNNAEIVAMLEEKQIKPTTKESAQKFFEEAVQCHHNDIANYIREQYIENDKEYKDNGNNENENNDNDNNENENNDNDNNENENNDNDNNENENNDNDNNENDNNDKLDVSSAVFFKSYNFDFIESKFINRSNFLYLCYYDYTFFVKSFIDDMNYDDLNEKINTIYNKKEEYIESYEHSALFDAVSNDYSEIVEILLTNKNIDVNYSYKQVDTIKLDGDLFLPLMLLSLISSILVLFSSYFLPLAISFLLFTTISLLVSINNVMHYLVSIRILFNIISLTTKSCEFLKQKVTVLHKACLLSNSKIVKILLSNQNIDVNAVYKYNPHGFHEYTALTLALDIGNDEIVKCLLSNPNIDVNIAKKQQWPRMTNKMFLLFISLASVVSNKLIILSLIIIYSLLHFTTLKSFLKLLFIQSIIILMLWLLLKMLSNKFYVVKLFTNIIRMNSIFRFLTFIEYLCLTASLFEFISSFLFLTYNIDTPLHLAIANNNVECVKNLLENKNIDVNSLSMTKKLIFRDIDCSDYSFDSYKEESIYKTALNMAVEINNSEIVKLLLSNNVIDINAKSKYASYKRIVIFRYTSFFFYIIESVICSIFASRSIKSSLDIAVHNRNVEIVKMLLENNQIEDVKNEYEKLKKRKNSNDSSIKDENDINDSETKIIKIVELLQNFISDNKLKQ